MSACDLNPRLCTPECWDGVERLSRGEAVPGAHGACPACHHAKVWHKPATATKPCMRCSCARFDQSQGVLDLDGAA